MVAKMKKISFLAYHKEYESFLHELRELGLVHVAETPNTVEHSEQLQDYIAQLKKLNNAKNILNKQIDKKSEIDSRAANIEQGKSIPLRIEEIENEKALLNQQLQVSSKERELLLPWDDFDPDAVKRLEEKAGYKLNFFIVSDNQYKTEWEEFFNAIIIKRETSKTYFVTFTPKDTSLEEMNNEAVKLPKVSLSQLNGLIDSIQAKIAIENEKLKDLAAELPSVKEAIKHYEQQIVYTKVKQSYTGVADNKIMLLQGWALEEDEQKIADYLESKSAYFHISDPLPEDDVPIKFKNNRFARLFEPIAEMYMLPKYNEIDLTPYFAPFYMIFFGLALGDIGYGLFLLLAGAVAKIALKSKLSQSLKAAISLLQVLGTSTMICGLLTGGFFGFSLYDIDIPIIQSLKNKVFFDNNMMFNLSLILGVIQILFGMGMKAANRAKQQGFKYALSTIAWIVFLVSICVAAIVPKVLPMFGTIHLIIVIPAVILILFYNSPGKNPLVNFGLGLWDTYGTATGLLGDILSYVRLFALGLSGGILASVFNSLADGMSPDNAIVKPIVYILIFLIGHAINIFMNVLGAFVHPLRLTFVEFYKNSEFEGGGKKFNPFRK